MDESRTKTDVETSRLVVLVERHLSTELELLDQLDSLNQTLKRALDESGASGVSSSRANELNVMADALSKQSIIVREKRAKTLHALNSGLLEGQPQLTIAHFIRDLPSGIQKNRLARLRESILDQMTDVHATLIGNQAVMFYTHDFYRKMVNGLLNRDADENQYSLNGAQPQIKPGNLYRKVC